MERDLFYPVTMETRLAVMAAAVHAKFKVVSSALEGHLTQRTHVARLFQQSFPSLQAVSPTNGVK
jgi:hypothetical protein